MSVRVIKYKKVVKFYEDNLTVFMDKESISQLILFNAIINKNATSEKDFIFGKVIDDKNQTVLLFWHCKPYNLLVHEVTNTWNKEAVIALADFIVNKRIPIKGINAKKSICDTFIARYTHKGKKKAPISFQLMYAMDIMELRELKNITLTEGFTRLANIEDKELIARWMVNFAKDALGENVLYEEQLVKTQRMIDKGIIYLYNDPNNNVVSMAATSRTLPHGVSINYVYTPMEYRGKGYAKANMYRISKSKLDQGYKFCSLFVDKLNPISNKVYMDIGYEIMEDQYDYRIAEGE